MTAPPEIISRPSIESPAIYRERATSWRKKVTVMLAVVGLAFFQETGIASAGKWHG
jgi:hypothetical protein